MCMQDFQLVFIDEDVDFVYVFEIDYGGQCCGGIDLVIINGCEVSQCCCYQDVINVEIEDIGFFFVGDVVNGIKCGQWFEFYVISKIFVCVIVGWVDLGNYEYGMFLIQYVVYQVVFWLYVQNVEFVDLGVIVFLLIRIVFKIIVCFQWYDVFLIFILYC